MMITEKSVWAKSEKPGGHKISLSTSWTNSLVALCQIYFCGTTIYLGGNLIKLFRLTLFYDDNACFFEINDVRIINHSE